MWFPITRFRIEDKSMLPTLAPGDYVLVSRLSYSLKKARVGDIIVLRLAKKNLIKRIVEVRDDGYFVDGDNKDSSQSSKDFGLIKMRQIIGKVVLLVH